MIVDHLDNWKHYTMGTAWKYAMDFLHSLSPDAEERRYELQGEDMFASIASYQTIPQKECVPEAHRKYTDIQVLLSGSEYIDWCPQKGLEVDTPYVDDIELYKTPESGSTRLYMRPGIFAVFFPQDAHRPQMMIGQEPQTTKKVVIKVKCELLEP